MFCTVSKSFLIRVTVRVIHINKFNTTITITMIIFIINYHYVIIIIIYIQYSLKSGGATNCSCVITLFLYNNQQVYDESFPPRSYAASLKTECCIQQFSISHAVQLQNPQAPGLLSIDDDAFNLGSGQTLSQRPPRPRPRPRPPYTFFNFSSKAPISTGRLDLWRELLCYEWGKWGVTNGHNGSVRLTRPGTTLRAP